VKHGFGRDMISIQLVNSVATHCGRADHALFDEPSQALSDANF
jgi:hypothetical protein